MRMRKRDDMKRPICQTEGCNKGCQNTAKAIAPIWRKYCSSCHVKRMKNFRKLSKNLNKSKHPKCCIKNCKKKTTLLGTNHTGELKFSNYCETHGGTPFHLSHRKTWCENEDGRLGFKCTSTIIWDPPLPEGCDKTVDYGYPQPMLQVDHIDGNPYNEPLDGSNFQTLCCNCHMYKTWKNGDGQSAGRKTLKKTNIVLTTQ